ncbi:MAG: hypothetical protein K5644_09185, partial [Lachnospiraceae bacterium]|nr:hypothetical protein [Lachnospiraceae bacterium]
MKVVNSMSRRDDEFNVEVVDINGSSKKSRPKGKKSIKGPSARKNRQSNIEVEKIDARGKRHRKNDRKQNSEQMPEANLTNRSRNVQFAVVMYFFLALFIALCAYFCYFVGFKSDDFINSPYNSRLEV